MRIVLFVFGILAIIAGVAGLTVRASAVDQTFGALAFGFGVVMLGLGAIAARLDRADVRLRSIERHLFRLAHPEVPWPELDPDEVVFQQRRGDGREWRMFADGRWEARTTMGRWNAIDQDGFEWKAPVRLSGRYR